MITLGEMLVAKGSGILDRDSILTVKSEPRPCMGEPALAPLPDDFSPNDMPLTESASRSAGVSAR